MGDRPREFGRYVLLKALGSGGTGDVYLARPSVPDPYVPTPIVIKRLHDQLGHQEAFVQRFAHEAAIAVTVESPHVAKLYDVGRVGDTFYLALEYIAGWTLSRLMHDFEDRGRAPPIDSVADIICGALDGLSALHEARHPQTGERIGFIHRDIAPKNIMVGEDGVPRLIDLGLGRSSMQDWKTSTGIVMGSPGYMAPEQVIADEIDQRADVFAMGIVLWEMLTQRSFIKRAPLPIMLRSMTTPVFDPPSKHRPDVSPELDAVVVQALALDRQYRFESAAAFRHALRAAVPQTRPDGTLPTMIGDMLWGELASSKTEVTQLLSRAVPTPVSEPEAVEVLATRYQQAPTPTNPHVAPYASPATGTPTYTTSGDLQSGGVPLKAVVGLMFMMLLLGVSGTLLFTMTKSDASDVQVAPLVERAPAVTVLPQAAEAPSEETANEAAPAEPAPVQRTTRKRRAAKRPPPPPPPTAVAPAPPIEKRPPKEALSRMQSRAAKLALETKDPDAKRLLTDIARTLRGSVDQADVDRLGRRVGELEKRLR